MVKLANPVSDVLKDLEWLSARKYFDYFDLCMVHRLIASGQPRPLAACLRFNRDHLERETRQSGHLALPRPRNNHGKRNFIYRGSQLFNELCTSVQCPQEMSPGMFKKTVRQMLHGV